VASVSELRSDREGGRVRIEDTEIAGVKVITPAKHGDHRGFFSEVYNRRSFEEAGLDLTFVQDNHAFSAEVGTIRGLHFQSPPFAQDKLVRVTRGRALDVVVDLRRSSKTFGRHFGIELSAENWRQLLIPIGFAHGYCTLEPDTELLYKVTNFYSAANDLGLAFDDPALAIDWGIDLARARLSEKDRRQPRLADLPFVFD
jgi:dTDP-4-dehydrorhamnose 3,5-epimerase